MARFAVALLVAAMAVTMVSAGGKATWTDCSSSSATAKGTLSAEIPAGSTFNVQAYFSGIRLLSQSGSVCKNSSISLPLGLGTIYVVGLNCPVPAGTLTLTEYAYLSETPPPGDYKIQLTASDPQGNQIVCVAVSWDA